MLWLLPLDLPHVIPEVVLFGMDGKMLMDSDDTMLFRLGVTDLALRNRILLRKGPVMAKSIVSLAGRVKKLEEEKTTMVHARASLILEKALVACVSSAFIGFL